MSVTDINGKKIEVTNLDKAIEQATMFSSMKHEDINFRNTDKVLNTYWNDMLNKLKRLQQA